MIYKEIFLSFQISTLLWQAEWFSYVSQSILFIFYKCLQRADQFKKNSSYTLIRQYKSHYYYKRNIIEEKTDMKKKVITLLLSLVLASGSIGNVQVLAAETTEQEAESIQETETAEPDEEPVEEAYTENAAAEVSEETPVPEDEEQDEENEDSNEPDSETENPANAEEFDTSEEAAAEVSETEEAEITDESEDAQDGIVDSGNYGDNITWTLTGSESDLTLTLSGSGPMDDIWPDNNPWKEKREVIKKAVIEEGITSVGLYAFNHCSNLTSVTIPDGVTSIDDCAFEYCTSINVFK